MDRFYDGAYAPSTNRVRRRGLSAAAPAAGPCTTTGYSDYGPGTATTGSGGDGRAGVRKGSLRNVVRRLFGKRSKELETQSGHRTPPRHTYHRSEPPALSAHPPFRQDYAAQEGDMPQRTLSAPLHIIPPPPFERDRVRSPYALQFPHSARLKPLDLPLPFDAPGSQLKRRKTLPSILMSPQDAADLSSSLQSSDVPPVPSLEMSRDTLTPDIGVESGNIGNAKRRSRSVDNLMRVLKASPPRKRSDEIRYWRESFQTSLGQGGVLRASGFTVPRAEEKGSLQEQTGEETPPARLADPFQSRESRSGSVGSSPPFEVRSTSAFGTEYSRDLEDRVGKLEMGLQNFQRMLNRIQADRDRRTTTIGGLDIPTRRKPGTARTPSMLAETLHIPLGPSIYQYDFTESQRPATSPQLPRTPTRGETGPVPPLPSAIHPTEHVSTLSPPRPQSPGGNISANGNSARLTQDVSFKSLYQMLADERSARRRLENRMTSLKNEFDTLQYQVQVKSTLPSRRSSSCVMLPPDPGAATGPSRLTHLLRGSTGEHSPRVSALSQEAVMSRFSGSTGQVGSEAGAQQEQEPELQTPHEAYQTPMEEWERGEDFPLVGSGGGGGGGGGTGQEGMF